MSRQEVIRNYLVKAMIVIAIPALLACSKSSDQIASNSTIASASNDGGMQVTKASMVESNVKQFNRHNYGLNLVLPTDTDNCDIKFNESFGRLEIKSGDTFSYNMSQGECRISRERNELGSGIFVVEMLQSNDSVLYYRASLPDGSSALYHFQVCLERNGRNYTFYDDRRMIFNKAQTDSMLACIMKTY